ncbi:hypothetical protein ACJX0J_014102 [Zea mays]
MVHQQVPDFCHIGSQQGGGVSEFLCWMNIETKMQDISRFFWWLTCVIERYSLMKHSFRRWIDDLALKELPLPRFHFEAFWTRLEGLSPEEFWLRNSLKQHSLALAGAAVDLEQLGVPTFDLEALDSPFSADEKVCQHELLLIAGFWTDLEDLASTAIAIYH